MYAQWVFIDAVINNDWENGIPQFADVKGGEIENNEFYLKSPDEMKDRFKNKLYKKILYENQKDFCLFTIYDATV